MPVYPEFSRRIAVSKIGLRPIDVDLQASALECKQVADRLHIPLIEKLHVHYHLEAQDERVKAYGILRASIRQQCVVSLEIFSTTIDEQFEVDFLPKAALRENILVDPDQIDEIPYEKGHIDLGEAAVEQLALLLDLYPHKPGLDEPFFLSAGPNQSTHEVVRTTPFAALATLKDNYISKMKKENIKRQPPSSAKK